MEELEVIVQRMIDAGESEENIKLVIEEYSRLGKTNDVAEAGAPVASETPAPASGDSPSESTSLVSVQNRTAQPNVIIPEITGDLPELTLEDVTMSEEERAESDREMEEQRRKGREGSELYLRRKAIKDKTGLSSDSYPNLQIGTKTEKQSYMGNVVDIEMPIYEQADEQKMEEITANITSEYRDVFNSLMSNELEILQNYAEDPMTYEDELDQTHDQVFALMQKKYPGLDKRAFMDIVGKGGDGLFQTALNKVTAEDKERDDAENLLGATTLDEDVYKQIFNQTSQNFSEKELKKQELNTIIRKKNRDLIELQKKEDKVDFSYNEAKEIKRLTSEIKTHQSDIQKLATTTEIVGKAGIQTKQVIDKKLASSYMDKETTEYRQGKINKAKKNLKGNLSTQTQSQKVANPKLTDFEAHELLYKSKAYNLQQLWAAGNTEKINLKFNGGSAPDLYNKLIEAGYISKKQQENYNKLDLNVPIKALFDAGYDGRDFEGLSNKLGYNVDISEKDRKQLLNYESSIYRNKGELELLHELTYINNNPAEFDRGGTPGAFVRSAVSAFATHFTDMSPVEADKLASIGPGATESKMLDEFEKLGDTYNTTFKNEIATGEIDELGFTPDQLKAIEKTFGEEVGEGFGHFVPMLIELGVISAATGATMTATGMTRVLAGMRNAGGWKKTQYHAIMTMVEEGKMFTAGFDPGAGAGFYAGGQLTSGVTPFKKRFKWMDPLFQKVVKGGPVGAASAQIAFNLETAVQDLMGNKDFQATFDKHYGDLTFKDVVVESIVFSIAGATHVKKTDFMSTRRKYDAITELDAKMNELMESPTGQLGKEGVGRALETAFTTGLDGKIVRTRPEGYEMMSKEQQAKWEALNEAKKTLDQMVNVETTAIELDPNNKDFESNVNKMFTQPINETLKSVNKEFEGFKVEFTKNEKDARFPEGADGAAFLPGKGKDPGTALFLKSKFTPEKLTHEVLGHAGFESYFNRNPQAEVKFNKNISKLFEKFDFEAYDGTPLGEFIKKNYSKEIGKGNNIEPREFFAYMFELLTDPKIYYQKVAPTFFKEAKQELLSVLEESTGMKPKIRTARQFVDYIGRLSMDARRGLNIQAKVARLGDLDDISFLGIEFVENKRKNLDKAVEQGYSSKNLNRQKEVFLQNKAESEILIDGQKKETLLYTIDKHLFNADGSKKYKNTERFKRSQDFADAYEKILGPNGVLDLKIQEGMTDIIPTKQGMDSFVEKVKNKLYTRLIKNFNIEEGGGSLSGYMTEIAIPWEKTRVKEEYLKDKQTGKEGTISLDKMSEEGLQMQLEAPTSSLLEKLETEVLTPGRKAKEKKEGPQQYVDMIKDTFKTEKEKEKYIKDIDKAVVEADINIDVEKPTYKGIKKEVASVEKITKKDKEGNIIIDNKTGKPKLFTPTKEADATPAGRLPKVLEVVADKYGIPLKRMLANQTLNDKMRTKARNRILQTINNWKKSLPDGETISGTATGIANTSWSFLYNFPGGRGSFAAGKTAAGKPPVTRRKNITTQEILDAVGIDANGNFLPGTKYDSAIKEYIKLEAQWTAVQSMMKTGKGRFTQAALAEVGSGRNEALASKMIKEFSEAFDLSLEKTQDILLNYAIGNKLLVDKKYKNFLDRFKDHEFFADPRQAALWSAIEVEGLKGKTTATKFIGDFNSYWDNFKGELPDGITIKDMKALKPKAFYNESKGNVFVEVERLNKHTDLSVEFSKMLPKGFEKSLTFFKEAVGLHQRVTQDKEGRYAVFADAIDAVTGKKVPEIQGDFKGFIMDSRDGSPIINQPFVLARERALENLGKNVSNLWKGIVIKFKSASAQEKGQKEIAEAGGDFNKQLKIAEKYFTELDNKTKEDIYFAIEATKQEFIEAGKNKQEKLDRIEWMYNVARSNTNLRMGVRQTVPVKYVFFPEGKITGEKIKLEHLKAMVTQSIQTANLVASGTFKKAGKEVTSDFLGITSIKNLLDIVDNLGGTTNTSGLYRMALLNPKILSQYKSVESGFKRTLLEDILIKFEKEVGTKKFKELQKQNETVEKQNRGLLKSAGLPYKNLSLGEMIQAMKVYDNASINARKQKLASKDLGKDINDIVEYSLGIESNKVFSKAEGKVRGKDIKRRRVFMPDTASDLELLLEPLYGKGKKGIENKKWFEDNFIGNWERGVNDFNNARQAITNDYMSLRKSNKDVVKKLSEAVEGTNFTNDMAMRVYIWNKNGFKIPDLVKTSEQKLVDHVKNNPKLQAYAENLARLTKLETGLKEPSAEWWGETIATEIQGLGEGVGRKKYLQDFIDAKNMIFTEANLNKMESKLGTNWRETIEDMFDRMETGRTRSMNIGKTGTAIMNYFNGSVGAIMNFNTRSGVLQLISTVNFVNSSFNNPLMAAKAFANQPQYWKDFMRIMNSDMLKQRRAGLEINVTEAELASATKGKRNPAKAALAHLLKIGFLPTKIADSFAISSGGATYYRNAINKYTKEGLSKAEAERKAFIDFQAIAERTQQSSRADLLSKQQTSFEGRLILPFANTPMQMNRIMVKDVLDISKGRFDGYYGEGSLTSKLSRIGYYGFAQSLIFAGLQSGAFALMTNSDDDKKIAESKLTMLNTVADSFLRGMGIQGAVINGFRLAIQEFIKQDGKKYNADYSEVAEKLLNISPTVGSKFSKLDAAGNTYKYNKKVIKEEGLTLNGPLMEASTQVIEATTNLPLNRYYKKGNNIQNAADDSYYNWQRVLMSSGWSNWGLGVGKDEERTVVVNKGKENEYTKYLTKEQLRRGEVEGEVKEKKKEEKKKTQQRCTKIKSDGTRCKLMVVKPKTRCHYHD